MGVCCLGPRQITVLTWYQVPLCTTNNHYPGVFMNGTRGLEMVRTFSSRSKTAGSEEVPSFMDDVINIMIRYVREWMEQRDRGNEI